MSATLDTLLRYPLVPVFYHPDAAYAGQVLRACYAAGLRVFEFTNRGPAAVAVFATLVEVVRAECPDMLLGIGTIFTAAEAEQFIDAGAAFVVQPCATADVAAVCQARAVAWLPGAQTVSEVYQATRLGAALVKIFPGNVVGPGFVKSLRGPLPHVPLMVTGGVSPTAESIGEWLGAGANAVGLGAQLFPAGTDPATLVPQLTALLAEARRLTGQA
ncbi:bifunctional 4-hydroxy-2-oxoglutarate aldolase/2-dehydro-3-deoxy-phosphogluconate aldolase [Hymenobacter artigasi]|uniref:2-dehydro-3-deoxyphosphogluconate aldolase/(4S)-4-hydroxy-2-oxoglutarate aldolase n=1 Tax=Hymenobacter artigasi TaxID=2719616 RepID=A0ABX1HL41_9BACT|nr:bifunctional 4-hydroxy-2-oxoglutarate aldolase/2-dehydro-3-deoxy-phosphogluconate aldolase [Hymenobacter artigasi]NKI90988.1 2-dehydro-3-deoxyphosphogluconate aldolase/(4S)-4-hydroxy-2-oxoglutarate aldolase [Hymenobacter artigasi]